VNALDRPPDGGLFGSMKREEKAQVVERIASQMKDAEAIYAVDYRGLSVSQAASLRQVLREADASFRIVKNTLTLRAAEEADAEHVKALVEGPTALTFVKGDPVVAAKALEGFARRERVMELRGGVLNGEPLTAERLRELARLPAREQLNAQLAGVVASPLTGLARGLGALLGGLAVALGQLREKREDQGEGDAPAEEGAPAPEDEKEA
jgi:large subunit ribosomal protein L10